MATAAPETAHDISIVLATTNRMPQQFQRGDH